jgi:DNA polymerase alpha subunit A
LSIPLPVFFANVENPLPLGTSGKSFSHVFGTNTKALELFLLKRRLMGPCWIKITNWTTSSKPISWCKNEIIVNDPKSVAVATEQDNAPKESPPMHVLSLSIRTVMNQHHNSNEIVSATGLIYDTVNVDGETIKLEGKQFTALRQLNDIPLPVNLQAMMKSIKTKVDILPNEKALLSFLIANIHRHDPDIIVGHNVIDFDLDVLLHRMKVNKVEHWSRIGRLRRTQWPKLQDGAGGTGDSSSAERMIASGRLLCDTYRAAQDLLSSKSYSLTYLAATQLKIERANIEYEKIASYFWSAKELVDMIEHSQFDTYLTAQLMFKFQVLPLTKQLTNLAGNLWSRTMMGARAERNEYLLLHEFHNRKYICPDKMPFNQNPLNEEEGAAKKGKKKPAYSGGLVLEPKKGFYDKYVLMLDFNSLYPSIIQEYNICFTSVLRNYDIPDYMPEVPETSVTKGVLPTVLGTLVERRRMVKALLKNPAITAGEYAQFDIRQKALKLTANSMYGCLGFTQSRFYAKPIAMLITSKGREILQNTVTLAESTELEVIYGDTDSIMIHTNTQDLAKVKKMGADLKKAVNKRYNLLEIEMDGFFQKMLLLKKKKYAALAVTEKDGKITTSLETKGLDLVRRDWCGISHDVSNYVLNQLFSENENREEIVDKIHIYLTKVGEQVNAGEIPLDKFVITKVTISNSRV